MVQDRKSDSVLEDHVPCLVSCCGPKPPQRSLSLRSPSCQEPLDKPFSRWLLERLEWRQNNVNFSVTCSVEMQTMTMILILLSISSPGDPLKPGELQAFLSQENSQPADA